jgi:prolyl-tRNA synthetase
MAKNQLPSKKDNPAEWYTAVIRVADLADYGPAKGTMIIKPYGYAIWERVQKVMDEMIKDHGVENAYFPMFIPMNLLEKEAAHVEGFSPELAVVTHGGGQKLEEPLAVRPTSEVIMYESYAKWIQSYRDLPVMMNQWNNVVRWEKRTSLFMRTTEFLWQEGHTAHATHEEAVATQEWAMDMYKKIYNDYFAIYGHVGFKSAGERFAGADNTLTFEALMPSGKALQSCTSHDLGQNFSKTFGISFQDKEGTEQNAWQTSWGLSTRSIGGLILAHGDDNGLRLPPNIAPVQVVIIPIRTDDESVMEFADNLQKQLKDSGVRVSLDDRDDESMGWKINKWEVKGVPVRVEIGPKEVEQNQVTVAKRHDGSKEAVDAQGFVEGIQASLDAIQSEMFEQSKAMSDANTREAKTYDEFKQIIAEHKGFVKVHWNDNKEIEDKIQAETKATSRCAVEQSEGVDFYTGEPANQVWYFAQSY